MTNLTIPEVAAFLREQECCTILTHRRPDGDTVGSAIALCRGLRALGKEAVIYENPQFTPRYLPYLAGLTGREVRGTVVAADIAAEGLFPMGFSGSVDLCIDHHGSNSGFALETLVEPEAAAAAELLTSLIPAMGVELTPDIAACLYTGLATDTGCFRFTNTTAATHRAAAALIEAGADVESLNERLFECRSHARITAEKLALESLDYYYDDRCALICLTWDQIESAGVDGAELEDLTSLPRSIDGVEVGLTLRQQKDGSYKISVRTGHNTNACSIARRLGGGGHPRAAGCEISGNLDNAKHAILEEVKKELDRAQE